MVQVLFLFSFFKKFYWVFLILIIFYCFYNFFIHFLSFLIYQTKHTERWIKLNKIRESSTTRQKSVVFKKENAKENVKIDCYIAGEQRHILYVYAKCRIRNRTGENLAFSLNSKALSPICEGVSSFYVWRNYKQLEDGDLIPVEDDESGVNEWIDESGENWFFYIYSYFMSF